jgi:hypothetical protein
MRFSMVEEKAGIHHYVSFYLSILPHVAFGCIT